MSRAWLTESPIDGGAVAGAVQAAEHGATVLFVGTVRSENSGRLVSGIRYEAYPAMAERVLASIVGDAEARWPGSAVAAVHRLGDLGLGEASVAVAAAAPHRDAAFEAGRYVIEEIKKRLPVWKKERYADGTEAWLGGAIPPAAGGDRG
jgi:molybdopterin synthase catalytic subunit